MTKMLVAYLHTGVYNPIAGYRLGTFQTFNLKGFHQLRSLTPQLTKRRNVETSRVYTLPCCAFCSFNLLPFKMILFVYIILHHTCTCPLFLFATPHWACKCSAFILCIEDKEKSGSDEHKELINSLSLSGSHERHVDGSIRGNLHYYRPLLRCILAMQGHCLLLRVWIVQ